MRTSPRPLDRLALIAATALCASWGLNQVAAKLALADFGPVTQSALRSTIGSIVIIGYAAIWRREVFRSDRTLGLGLVIGGLFTFEFIALFVAVKFTTAASVSLFLFTAPFFVALGAVLFLPAERLRPAQWFGMALAFLGVGVALYRPTPGATLFGDWLALFAGAAWGATTVTLKATRLVHVEPIKNLLYQTITSAFVSIALAYAAGESWPAHISALGATAVIYQSAWVVGVTYSIWFWLLKVYHAAELSAFTFTTPVVGVFASSLILGEPLTISFLAALALVAAGIVIVNGPASAAMFRAVVQGVRQGPA